MTSFYVIVLVTTTTTTTTFTTTSIPTSNFKEHAEKYENGPLMKEKQMTYSTKVIVLYGYAVPNGVGELVRTKFK